jgi:arginase family enzyme
MTSVWPNLLDLLTRDEAAPVGWVGAPLGTGSVTPGRCDLAPGALRAVLRRIGRYDVDSGKELGTAVCDRGDLKLNGQSIEDATPSIRNAVGVSTAAYDLTLLIGGNNAVTRPGVLGLADALGVPVARVGLITLDAHFDLRDTAGGLGNGNPVRALREDGLPGANICQIGLAPYANSRAMHQDALDGGHLVLTARDVRENGAAWAMDQALARLEPLDAILLDCDIDVIDRSQFPGAPGGRAGGLSALDFYEAVKLAAAFPKVRVIDLTEWDPPLDPTDLSALTAGRWLAEVLSGFEERP